MDIYTLDEVNQEIEDTKSSIGAALQSIEYSKGDRRLVREKVSVLREHLEWLAGQKTGLENGSRSVVRQGRIAR